MFFLAAVCSPGRESDDESALSPGGHGPGIAVGSCSSRLSEPRGITAEFWPLFLPASRIELRVSCGSVLWVAVI